MLFSCSSGATARYLEDIIRAVSMPAGTQLQFRYATQYIHSDAVATIEKDRHAYDGSSVVLTYLDQSHTRRESERRPKAIPCRVETIRSVQMLGTSYVFLYELGGFVFPKTRTTIPQNDPKAKKRTEISYNDYQDYLVQQGTDAAPLPLDWKKEDVPQSAKGSWFCEVKQPNLDIVPISKSNDVWLNWEQLVQELARSSDFKEYFAHDKLAVFHHVLGISDVRSKSACKISNNLCVIPNPGEYAIEFYVYATVEEVPKTTWLCVSSLNQRIGFHSNPALVVDSGYDIKKIQFYVPPSSKVERAIITIDFRDDPAQEFGRAPYDLALDIRPQYTALAISSLAIGLGGSVSGLVALWKASPAAFPTGLAVVVVLAAWALSFAGAYFASGRRV